MPTQPFIPIALLVSRKHLFMFRFFFSVKSHSSCSKCFAFYIYILPFNWTEFLVIIFSKNLISVEKTSHRQWFDTSIVKATTTISFTNVCSISTFHLINSRLENVTFTHIFFLILGDLLIFPLFVFLQTHHFKMVRLKNTFVGLHIKWRNNFDEGRIKDSRQVNDDAKQKKIWKILIYNGHKTKKKNCMNDYSQDTSLLILLTYLFTHTHCTLKLYIRHLNVWGWNQCE